MAQGNFTKQEAQEVKKAVDAIFTALPKSKQMNYLGELNDVLLFIEAAARAAPNEPASEVAA